MFGNIAAVALGELPGKFREFEAGSPWVARRRLPLTALGPFPNSRGEMKKVAMGERIRQLRLEEGISLRELARRADISASFVSEIESGRYYPTGPVLEKIAAELKATAADLSKLDNRASLSDLRQLLKADPGWGPVFEVLATGAKNGQLTPAKVLKKLA